MAVGCTVLWTVGVSVWSWLLCYRGKEQFFALYIIGPTFVCIANYNIRPTTVILRSRNFLVDKFLAFYDPTRNSQNCPLLVSFPRHINPTTFPCRISSLMMQPIPIHNTTAMLQTSHHCLSKIFSSLLHIRKPISWYAFIVMPFNTTTTAITYNPNSCNGGLNVSRDRAVLINGIFWMLYNQKCSKFGTAYCSSTGSMYSCWNCWHVGRSFLCRLHLCRESAVFSVVAIRKWGEVRKRSDKPCFGSAVCFLWRCVDIRDKVT